MCGASISVCPLCGREFKNSSSLAGHIARVHPVEARDLLRGGGNPFYGKRHSAETKKKISIHRRGKGSHSPPTKGKTYEEYFGAQRAREIKKKIGLASRKPVDLSPSPSLAYILGAWIGDGYSRDRDVVLRVTSKEFASEFAHNLRKLGINPSIRRMQPHGKGKKEIYRVMGFSKTLVELFKSLSYKDVEKIALSFPRDFIRGLFDAEGYAYIGQTVTEKGYRQIRAHITNTDLRLLEVAKKCVEKLGFRASIHKHGERSKRLSILGGKDEVKRFINTINPSTHVWA